MEQICDAKRLVSYRRYDDALYFSKFQAETGAVRTVHPGVAPILPHFLGQLVISIPSSRLYLLKLLYSLSDFSPEIRCP